MDEYLAFMMASWLCLLLAAALFFFGLRMLRPIVFPITFLIFVVPFPATLVENAEILLQHGSAEVAYDLFQLVGTPVLRQGTLFQLPGISFQVAPECSGIHSTLVLFITSLAAGHLFLHSHAKRAALALAVLPLALLRNGFRIFVIGELCVRVGPHMIESPIHHRGGPIFFALSLLPFFLLLWLLRRMEATKPKAADKAK
jgi:exosortase C (VPDSG-CTERM-specific)